MTRGLSQTNTPNERLLTFSSGGWVILLALLVGTGLVAWGLLPAAFRERPPGDGSTIESYQFDVSNLAIDREWIATPLLYRDMPPRWDDPPLISAAEAQRINEEQRGKYLVTTDRVVGVEINGEARAYPLSLLTVHEVINDTIAGVPVAVTYSWPGDAVRVFDRRLGDETLHLGISGMLYNANALMYDRRNEKSDVPYDQRGESLWSQLLGEAISGPLLGQQIQIIPAQLVSWAQWREMHPETTVIQRDPQLLKRYRRAAPTQYFNSADMPFPVQQPPAAKLEAKQRVIVVTANGQRRVYPLSLIAAQADAGDADARPVWTDDLAGVAVTFTYDQTSGTAAVEADGPIELVHCFWFLWHALHPDDEPAS